MRRKSLISEEPAKAAIQNSSTWHFLVRDFEISYHFSGAAWVNSAERPGVTAAETSFAGFAPGFKDGSGNPGPFNALHYAEEEVNGIGSLFGTVNGHSSVFTGAAATEKNFRDHARENSILHIATHSLIDDNNPMNSALVFASGNRLQNAKDMDDGYLHLDEISNLRLDASLVVLSACATGKGKVTKTEGVLALSRGFYIAGAGNILCSLWNIPDRITGSFMTRFYRNLLQGKSYSAALREAKLNMINNPATSVPYMWAGFVLLGR
jgi:CHAT domain-containing protein